MRTSVQKWGNSLAVRIPKAFANDLGIEQDVSVDLSMEDGALVVRPAKRVHFELESLLSKVTDENLHKEVDWGPAVGREIL